MSKRRGILPVLVTVAVVAGSFYVLVEPNWRDTETARTTASDVADRPAASKSGPDADAQPDHAPAAKDVAERSSESPPGTADPASRPEEAAVRGRTELAPVADPSEARGHTGGTDAGASSLPRAARTDASTSPATRAVPGTEGDAAGDVTVSAGSRAGDNADIVADLGERASGAVDRERERAAGHVRSAAPPPAAVEGSGRPAVEAPGEAASRGLAGPGTGASAGAKASADAAAGDESGRAAEASPAGAWRQGTRATTRPPAGTGEAPSAGEAGPADVAALESPEDWGSGWRDFGITSLRRTFDRLFGRQEPEDRLQGDASGGPEGKGPGRAGDGARPPADVAGDGGIRSKSEETIRQAVRAMGARADPELVPAAGPADEDSDLDRPAFDIVRVERDGSAVIAGRAPPGSAVDVLAGEKVIDRVTADRRGAWVSVTKMPLEEGDQTLSLTALRGDGTEVRSDDVVVVATRASPPAERQVVKAVAPAEAGRPAGQPADQPAGVVPALAPTQQPVAVLLPREREGPGRILQAPGRISNDGTLALLALDYDHDGRVRISGEAPPGAAIRIYVDNVAAGEAVADGNGTWSTVLEDRLGPGTYTLRLDQLDPRGKTVARLETPFSRVDQPPREGDVAVDYVVVQPGNSLWRIARRLSGRGMAYVHIYDANQAQIRDPDLIYPGQVFQVPSGFGRAG